MQLPSCLVEIIEIIALTPHPKLQSFNDIRLLKY